MKKTQVCSNGGSNPVWNEDLYFELKGNETQLLIEVFDKQTTGDDRYMAEYTAPMSQITKYGIDGHVDLFDKNNKPEGKLYMVAKIVEAKKPSPPQVTAPQVAAQINQNIPIVQGYPQPMMMQGQQMMMMQGQPMMMMQGQQMMMPVQQQSMMMVPTQQSPQIQVLQENQYPDIKSKPTPQNPYEIPSEASPVIFGMTKKRLIQIFTTVVALGLALGLGLGLGLQGKGYLNFPDLKKSILDSQPYAFTPPPPQQKSRRLQQGGQPKPKPKPAPAPGPQSRLCNAPSDPFTSEDCAIQFVKDVLYGDEKKLGIFTNSVTMMDNHLKKIKQKYSKPAQCVQDPLVEYNPSLPHKASQPAPPMKYKFNCYDDTDQELWPNSKSDKKGKIYFGEDDTSNIFYVAEFFAMFGNKNMLLAAVDMTNKMYDYWHIASTQGGDVWTLHSTGSFNDYTIQTTVAGTVTGQDSANLPLDCGILLLSTSTDIFGQGIFDAPGRNGKTCSDYLNNANAPNYQSWGGGLSINTNKFCSKADVLDANKDFQAQGNSWPCYNLNQAASTMPFQFLMGDDMSPLKSAISQTLDDWSTKLSKIKKISVPAKTTKKKKKKATNY